MRVPHPSSTLRRVGLTNRRTRNCRAVSRPMPEVLPVTSARLFFSRSIEEILSSWPPCHNSRGLHRRCRPQAVLLLCQRLQRGCIKVARRIERTTRLGYEVRSASSQCLQSHPVQSKPVKLAMKVSCQGFAKYRVVFGSSCEQRHRRLELQIVGITEDLLNASALGGIHQRCAFPEPRTQYRVRQICLCLSKRPYREPLRNAAGPKTLDLRKDEPHPVTALLPSPQLTEHVFEDTLLSIDEALQVVGIVHLGSPTLARGQSHRRQSLAI
jgi:hypothetical protein